MIGLRDRGSDPLDSREWAAESYILQALPLGPRRQRSERKENRTQAEGELGEAPDQVLEPSRCSPWACLWSASSPRQRGWNTPARGALAKPLPGPCARRHFLGRCPSEGQPLAPGGWEALPDPRPELARVQVLEPSLGCGERGDQSPCWIEGPWVQAMNWGFVQGGGKGRLGGVC